MAAMRERKSGRGQSIYLPTQQYSAWAQKSAHPTWLQLVFGGYFVLIFRMGQKYRPIEGKIR